MTAKSQALNDMKEELIEAEARERYDRYGRYEKTNIYSEVWNVLISHIRNREKYFTTTKLK